MRIAKIVALALFGLALAGCSGTNSLPPVANGNAARARAQSEAQSAVQPVSAAAQNADMLGGSVGALDKFRRPLGIHKNIACTNQFEETVVQVSQNEITDDRQYFYDQACTQLAKIDFVDIVATQTTETRTRTITRYNVSGGQVTGIAKATAVLTGAPGNFTALVTGAFYIGASPTAAGVYSRQFVLTPNGTNAFLYSENGAYDFNNATIAREFGGDGTTTNATVTADPNTGNITLAGTHNQSYFTSALNGLSISANPPYTLSGGTSAGTGSLVYSVTFDTNLGIQSLTASGTTKSGDVLTMSSTGAGPTLSVTGTIVSGTTTVATFAIGEYGDGTVTFANGDTAAIIDWRVR